MSFITDWISDALNGIIYGILVFIPIGILDAFSEIVKQLSSKQTMDQILGIGQDGQGKIYVPPLFLAFAIISIASLAIIISWNMIVALVKKEDEMKIRIVNSIKNSCKVAFSFLRYCFEEVKQSANYII